MVGIVVWSVTSRVSVRVVDKVDKLENGRVRVKYVLFFGEREEKTKE